MDEVEESDGESNDIVDTCKHHTHTHTQRQTDTDREETRWMQNSPANYSTHTHTERSP